MYNFISYSSSIFYDCFRLSVVNSYIRSFLILKGNILHRMNETNEGTHALATKRFHLSTALQKNPVGVALFLHHALTDSLISHVNWMLRCTVARVIDFAFSFFFLPLELSLFQKLIDKMRHEASRTFLFLSFSNFGQKTK